jgi:hypothetical protein
MTPLVSKLYGHFPLVAVQRSQRLPQYCCALMVMLMFLNAIDVEENSMHFLADG